MKLLRNIYLYSFLSGFLLSLGWLQQFSGVWLFIAWIPMLYVNKIMIENNRKYHHIQAFFISYLAFGIWNFISFWWSVYAHWSGVFATTFVNSLFMAVVFWSAHFVERKTDTKTGRFAFVVFWLVFEYLHFRWDLAFPWLTLGNAFAKDTWAIQWYEYTGVLGGSAWIFAINLMIFHLYNTFSQQRKLRLKIANSILLLLIIFVPVGFSFQLKNKAIENSDSFEVLIVQPNTSPYKKYESKKMRLSELKRILSIADTAATKETKFIVLPENALPVKLWENKTKTVVTAIIHDFLSKHNDCVLITGATTYRKYTENENITPTARKHKRGFYYDTYNSALMFSKADSISIYHKSKLLIGPEKIPIISSFNFLQPIIQKAGGMPGSFGTQASVENFEHIAINRKIAPVICWESVFGEYVSQFVRQGAGAVFVLTNDGWWNNTAGHKVHLHLSRLRAIENRCYIVRAAQTGISAIIDEKGGIVKYTLYDKLSVLKSKIYFRKQLTFYAKNGDAIGRISIMMLVLILIYTFVHVKTRKSKIYISS